VFKVVRVMVRQMLVEGDWVVVGVWGKQGNVYVLCVLLKWWKLVFEWGRSWQGSLRR